MLNVAVLGTGWAGSTHLNAYKKNAATSVVAVLSAHLERAQRVSAEYGCAAYDSFDEMMSQHRIDVIDICLPTYLHKEYLARCLAHHVHILCEKPLALTHEEASAVRDMAAGYPQKLMIAYTMRFFGPYECAREMIADGRYGHVKSLYFHRLCPMPPGAPWREDAGLSGGGILDLGIHDIDCATWCLGCPESVHAVGSRMDGTDNWVQTFITLQYPGERHAVIEANQNMPQTAPYTMGYRIHFDRATVTYNFTAPEKDTGEVAPLFGGDLKVYEHGGASGHAVAFNTRSPYEREIDYFVDRVMRDKPIEKGSLEDAVAGLRLYELARDALGRR